MKGWKVALLGIATLGVVSVCQGKVIVLDAAPNTSAIVTPGALAAAFTRRSDLHHRNYVQSAYIEPPYGILSVPAATNANYEPAAALGGTMSFRELSNGRTREQISGSSAQGSFGSTAARDDGATGTADAFVTLLTICGLAVYQLRRKQQLLRHLPLFP